MRSGRQLTEASLLYDLIVAKLQPATACRPTIDGPMGPRFPPPVAGARSKPRAESEAALVLPRAAKNELLELLDTWSDLADGERPFNGEEAAWDLVEALAEACRSRGLDEQAGAVIRRFCGRSTRTDRRYSKAGLRFIERIAAFDEREPATSFLPALESSLDVFWSNRVGPEPLVAPSVVRGYLREALQEGVARTGAASMAAVANVAKRCGLDLLASACCEERILTRLDGRYQLGFPDADEILEVLTLLLPIEWTSELSTPVFRRVIERPACAYVPGARFSSGDVAEHPRFGRGVVLGAREGRLDIQFATGVRTLAAPQ